jgi:anti-sigma B factor antagonist
MSDIRTPPLGDQASPGTVDVEHRAPGLAVVTLIGEHDLSGKQRLNMALATASAKPNVLVDLSGCSFMDSSVIEAIFFARNQLVERGGRLELVIPPEAAIVRRVAELTLLDTLLPIHAAHTEGFASLQAEV